MKINFNLYGSNGYISNNTLDESEFERFRTIAESFKQTIKIEKVES
jgi:hypothetical protein